MELPKRSEEGRARRTKDGKRFRTPEEFQRMCEEKGEPCCFVRIYNRKEKLVIEALKNMKTKHTHILKARRPTDAEEREYGSMLTREQLMTGKTNQDQLEVVISGDEYKKQPLKSK